MSLAFRGSGGPRDLGHVLTCAEEPQDDSPATRLSLRSSRSRPRSHDGVEHEIDWTRVVCNLQGYAGHEVTLGFDPCRIIEIASGTETRKPCFRALSAPRGT
jgi:hypothetical protein